MSEPLPSWVEELAGLVIELQAANAGLREVIAAQAERIAAHEVVLAAQAGELAELKRRLGKDSSTSSKPPSADLPYRKPQRRSSRRSSGHDPGKQPGAPGSAMPLVDNPDETVICDPGSCADCGAELSGAAVTGTARRQITDVLVPPPPWVTEYQIITRACPWCAARTPGRAPAGVSGRAQYGPGVPARAAELLCGHYLPVARATGLMASMLGVTVWTGFMAGVRGRAARLLEQEFLPRVRELLRQVGVLHVDQTPVVVVLDRPISPGNVGSLLRSADALGADGVIISGRAADIYDPKTVRASRGSLFAVPAVRAEAPTAVVDWLRTVDSIALVGTSEDAVTDIWKHDFRGPTAVVVGNETTGMSTFWATHCDSVVRIPMTGSASSFNATVAASITLYEIVRQRT